MSSQCIQQKMRLFMRPWKGQCLQMTACCAHVKCQEHFFRASVHCQHAHQFVTFTSQLPNNTCGARNPFCIESKTVHSWPSSHKMIAWHLHKKETQFLLWSNQDFPPKIRAIVVVNARPFLSAGSEHRNGSNLPWWKQTDTSACCHLPTQQSFFGPDPRNLDNIWCTMCHHRN